MRFDHFRTRARRGALAHAAAAAALAVLLAIVSSLSTGNAATAADNMAVDTDTSGNTATSLGSREGCSQVSAGSNVVIDVTITNVPTGTDAIVGFTFWLAYDPSKVTVTAADKAGLLSTAPGYNEFAIIDSFPDSDGSFQANVTDLNAPGVSGSGFLMRLTLSIAPGAPAGATSLGLTLSSTINMNNDELQVPALGARLAIGVTCESLIKQGDVDCGDTVNTVDALKVLRFVAGLSYSKVTEPCNNIGVAGMGDVDCSGTVNAVDALKIFRFVAGLPVDQTEPPPCRDIGT